MSNSMDIKNLIYQTVHRNKKTVAQIADETGISSNYLYRASLPLDESGVKLPVEYLIPLMRSTKNYSILNHIANLCGFMLVKMPRGNANKKDEIQLFDEYQASTLEALKSVKTFFSKPDKANYDKVIDDLNNVMTYSANTKKFVEKVHRGELELELWNQD